MLFNSYVFIFLFMPVTMGLFFALGHLRRYELAMGWLVLASLFFYGWWNPLYLGLILASMVFNYRVGLSLSRSRARGSRQQVALLAFGISLNVGLLAYYKYANFFVSNLDRAFSLGWHIDPIVLPLGISFFTFTQIAYLVDAYRGEAREYNAMHYGLFVTYFPHLIAGPVLHHKEMMPQFGNHANYHLNYTNLAAGLSYFAIGLFKKAVIADGVAPYAGPVFNAAGQGTELTSLDAWGGTLAYTFQLYFDFSGYSDMAIGLALMLGVRLPLNFDSPYKAVNIIDFWRRWHMTLSRFLRDYIYIPLGGSRHGKPRRYFNLLATMLIGGLWHGAGWTFILWGALHGLYLVVNHAWHALRKRLGQDPEGSGPWWGRWLARWITLLAVIVGWVFFRAADFDSARRVLSAMFTAGTWHLSPFYAEVIAGSSLHRWLDLAGFKVAPAAMLSALLLGIYLITVVMPNTQQVMAGYFWPPGKQRNTAAAAGLIRWQPTRVWVAGVAAICLWALLGLSSVSEFLYFQF
jgi:alginate O-acetyltransferase complex protein AlgI